MYRSVGITADLVLNIENYAEITLQIAPKTTVELKACGDKLDVTVTDVSGKKIFETTVAKDSAKVARQKASDEYFDGVGFAVPSMQENLPSLSRYFETPLDYSSVE